MEMFGGAGTTTFLLVKYYGLKAGANFELMCGIDLLCLHIFAGINRK